MTLLGKFCLKYMVALKPEIEARGCELVVFRSTGMRGRAFADLASQGSVVVSAKSRLAAAGLAGIPQIVAPGAVDMVTFAVWGEMSPHYADRPVYTHNRLIASVTVLMPLLGVEDWDTPGEALHDPQGLAAFTEELRFALAPLPPRSK